MAWAPDARMRRNTRYAQAVIRSRGGNARDMGAVSVVILHIGIFRWNVVHAAPRLIEVPAIHIVDLAIAVIVQEVAGDFSRIDPTL